MAEDPDDKGTNAMMRRIGIPVAITWLLIALTFLLPLVDSTRPPYFDLSGIFAEIAYWIAWSGSPLGGPILVTVLIAVLVTSRSISNQDRWREGSIIAITAIIIGGGGAALNENTIKTELKIPRPNVTLLAGVEGAGPLAMTAKQFYSLDEPTGRRNAMLNALSQESMPVSLSPLVASHWADETGYSFPSGHAYGAMLIASLFLALSVTFLPFENARYFYLLLPWACAVCYSRPILRVHTPTDITVGGLIGVVAGLAAWLLVRLLLQRFPSQSVVPDSNG